MDEKNANGPSGKRAAWREGIGPVLMATVIALGVAFALDVVDRYGDPEKHSAKQSAATSAKPKPKPPKKSTVRQGLPRFVVAVRRPGTALVVRDLRSGADLGTPVAPPPGQRFHQVAAAGGGAYIVSSYARGKVAFNKLSVTPDGLARDLTPIPRAVVRGVSTDRSDMAVGPGGSRIAYLTSKGTRSRVDVVTVATGAVRSWSTKAHGQISSLSLSGTALSFVWKNGQVRTLDTAAKGADLGASRPVLRLPDGGGPAVISPDGSTVMTGVSDESEVSVEAFSTATGKRTKVMWARKAQDPGRPARITQDLTTGHVLVMDADGRLYADPAQGSGVVPTDDLGDVAW